MKFGSIPRHTACDTNSERNLKIRLTGHSVHTVDNKLTELLYNVYYVWKTAHLPTDGNV